VRECAKDADILVFVLPHQFMEGICKQLAGHVKPTAIGVTLIKVTSAVLYRINANSETEHLAKTVPSSLYVCLICFSLISFIIVFV